MGVKLVRDLMRIGVTTCNADTPLVDAARILIREQLESLVILDSNSHAVGVLGRTEVVAAYGRSGVSRADLEALTVGEVMSQDVLEVPPDIPATAAAQLMLDHGVRALYLMHHDSGIEWPAAVFRFEDVLRYLTAESDQDVADMGAGAARKSPFDLFKERYPK